MSAATDAMNAARKAKSSQGDVGVVNNFKKNAVREEDKVYHFQLLQEYPDNWKPKDKASGKPLSPPYPRYYVVPNSGVAFDESYMDEDGKVSPRAREWRYIEGQPSIWNDEQPLLANLDDNAIQKMLGDSRNELKFEYGQMNVPGRHKLRLSALQIQDLFDGKATQYRPVPRIYKLHNPEKEVREEMTQKEKEFAAQKMAYECTVEHMLECAFIMGIPIDDQSEAGLRKIKLEFVKRAEFDPSNPKALDWFSEIVASRLTHVEYTFAQALSNGTLSTSQQVGMLTWTNANSPITDINPNGDTVRQLMDKYNNDDPKIVKLLKELEK